MRYSVVLRYIGVVMLLNAVFLLISALVSALNGFDSALYPLLSSAALNTLLGGVPMLFTKRKGQISNKEGYSIVVGAWLASCFFGGIPYLLWGGEFDVWSAWFESASGFTATGASSLSDIEALPKGLLFWRSCTHLLGGVGVIMFVLVIVPSMGRNRMALSSVELSTLAKDNYKYKTQKVVQILLSLYVGMTATEAVLLKLAGMDWFDAVNHAFSTIATGGFSTRNLSIAYYDSRTIEGIIMFFMVVSGIHFGIIFATLTGRKNNIFKSEVAKFYLGTILVAGALIALSLWTTGTYETLSESLRYSYFHTISILSTTAFATTDTSFWPPFSVIILIYLGFQCACAGSTSGGIKSDRVWLALKVLKAKIMLQQHPNAMIPIKLNGVTQDDSVIGFAMLFIVVYLLLILVGTLVLAATGIDTMSSFTMISSSIGNVGTGFGEIGSMGNFSEMSPFVKTWCSFFMLLGRLEIFGFIQIFFLRWWR